MKLSPSAEKAVQMLEKAGFEAYAVVGQQMLEEFISYIEETNEQAFEDLLNKK